MWIRHDRTGHSFKSNSADKTLFGLSVPMLGHWERKWFSQCIFIVQNVAQIIPIDNDVRQ